MKNIFAIIFFVTAPCSFCAERDTPPTHVAFKSEMSINLGKDEVSKVFYKGYVFFKLSKKTLVPILHLADVCKFSDNGKLSPVNMEGEGFGGNSGKLTWTHSISKPRVEICQLRYFEEEGKRKVQIHFRVLSDYNWDLFKSEGTYLSKGFVKIGNYTLTDLVFSVPSSKAHASDNSVVNVLGTELSPATITLNIGEGSVVSDL